MAASGRAGRLPDRHEHATPRAGPLLRAATWTLLAQIAAHRDGEHLGDREVAGGPRAQRRHVEPLRRAAATSACRSAMAGSISRRRVRSLKIRAARRRRRSPGRLIARTSAPCARRPCSSAWYTWRPSAVARYRRRGRPPSSAGGASSRDVMKPLSSIRPSVTYTVPRFRRPRDAATICRPYSSVSRSSSSTISDSLGERRGGCAERGDMRSILLVVRLMSRSSVSRGRT